jgi:cobalamin biosynthesis protein CobC
MNTVADIDPLTPLRGVYHGGDLAAARAAFPGAPEPWLDLSTGINPNGYPLPPLTSEVWRRLPDREGLARLESLAGKRYGARDGAHVVAAPGAQALIQLLPRLFRAESVGILGLTYGEYEQVWRAAGARVRATETLEALSAFDVAVVVNPNNPDGRLIASRELAALADKMARRSGLLIADEAFIDAALTDASLAPALPEATIVLRSFGKMYGLAGVRLGFAITTAKLADALRALLGPWAVSGPAIEIGAVALADAKWLEAAIADLSDRAMAVDRLLLRHGFTLIGGAPLFRLAAHSNACARFEALGRQGVLVRRFPARADWLRFGLPANEAAFARLDEALSRA